MNSKHTIKSLVNKTCKACRKGDPILPKEQVDRLLKALTAWQLSEDKSGINCRFTFNDFEETMDFVKKIAIIADKNDHHPDVRFGYNYCHVDYSTHAIQGLSENDFICAAQIDTLLF